MSSPSSLGPDNFGIGTVDNGIFGSGFNRSCFGVGIGTASSSSSSSSSSSPSSSSYHYHHHHLGAVIWQISGQK